MRKNIYEYEFNVKRNGRKQTVQQSETSKVNAEKRIKSKLKGVTDIKLRRKLVYPHFEGGKKA
jgi:hypothetical protein